MEGEEKERFTVTMLEGDDEQLKLRVKYVPTSPNFLNETDTGGVRYPAVLAMHHDMVVKRDEKKVVPQFFSNKTYTISYPSTEVALDQSNISEKADVFIFYTPPEGQAVRIHVLEDRTLTFEGQATTWEELPDLLEKTSDRQNLILELALEEGVLLSDVAEHISSVQSLSEELGFKDFSITKGNLSRSKEFDGAVPLETGTPQGTVADEASLRTESTLLSGLGAWVGAEVPSQRVSIQVAEVIQGTDGVTAHLAITNTSPVKIDISHRAVIHRQGNSWVRDFEMGTGLSFLGTLPSAPGSQSKASDFEMEPGEGRIVPVTPVQLSQPFILEFVCFAEERGLLGRRTFGQSIFVTTPLIVSGENKMNFQFRLVKENPAPDTEQMSFTRERNGEEQKEILNVQREVLLGNSSISDAELIKDFADKPQIQITFTEEGRVLLADITRQHDGERLALILDGRVLTSPRIVNEVPGGQVAISGNFTEEEATELVRKLNAAAQ